MGCWNKTCAISNLPIRNGEPVIGLFLTNVPGIDPYMYHSPLPFFVEGQYNDYGNIENESGVALDLLIDAIRNVVIKVDPEEGNYRGTAVDPQNLDFTGIMEADRDDLLRFEHNDNAGNTGTFGISHIQIRRDVWDDIFEKYSPEVRKSGDKWSGCERSLSTILDDYRDFYDILVADKKFGEHVMFYDKAFDNQDNYISILFRRHNFEASRNGILSAATTIRRLFRNNMSAKELFPYVENACRVVILEQFMRDLHRPWVMPAYAGQDGYTNNHTMFANIVIDVAERMSYDDE